MSEQAVVAVVAVVVSGVIGVASLGLNFWNWQREREHRAKEQRHEREERYRVELYDKRLEVHQQAYNWLMQLITPVRWVQDPRHVLRQTDMREHLRKEGKKARQWWD